eukprot:460652-Pelagomonas_calceolata.AAC.1
MLRPSRMHLKQVQHLKANLQQASRALVRKGRLLGDTLLFRCFWEASQALTREGRLQEDRLVFRGVWQALQAPTRASRVLGNKLVR